MFSTSWYQKCQWISGSINKNRLYCWYYLLFCENTRSPWNSTGYNNLKQLEFAMSIQKHEISKEHVHAALKFKLFGKQQSIAAALDSGHRVSILRHYEKMKENRDILKRLVDMTLYLSTQELAFRGHDETETSLNQGNFKELAKLLSTMADNKFRPANF
jgi:hypothetical protein